MTAKSTSGAQFIDIEEKFDILQIKDSSSCKTKLLKSRKE